MTEDYPSNPPPVNAPAPATNWRLYLELLSFCGFVFPFGNIIGPLILWMVKKDSVREVAEFGPKVINFNISWLLWSIASCGIGAIAWLIIAIIATIKAANNEPFKHPWALPLVK